MAYHSMLNMCSVVNWSRTSKLISSETLLLVSQKHSTLLSSTILTFVSAAILFRDVTELGNEYATTAYGASVKVPGNVDLLIAGTSCVDYSNLNNSKKEIDQKGESGNTFRGVCQRRSRNRYGFLANYHLLIIDAEMGHQPPTNGCSVRERMFRPMGKGS